MNHMNLLRQTAMIELVLMFIVRCNSSQPPTPILTLPPSETLVPAITFAPTLITPSPTALAIECIEFSLTPEECANARSHEYSTSTRILFDQSGQSCLIDNSDITISFEFLTAGNLHYTDSFGGEVEFAKKEHNIYTGSYLQPDGKFEWKYTITFTDAGFTEEANSYDLEKNELICTFVWEQEFITPSLTTTQIPPAGLGTPQSTFAATTIVPENFMEYDSTDFIKENNLADRIPVFSIKYPSEWEYGWFGDSGAIVLLISSVDVNDAWLLQDTSGATVLIGAEPYNGENLIEMLNANSERVDEIVDEAVTLTINGQDAARMEYIDNGLYQLLVLIVRENFALSVGIMFPLEKEAEFRPIVEAMINTIKIK